MYLINITVNPGLSAAEHETLFAQHTAWFKKHFDAGVFLMLGPYINSDKPAGVIFAHTDRDTLQKILEEDVYYPDKAQYEIREFAPKLIAANLPEFAGK